MNPSGLEMATHSGRPHTLEREREREREREIDREREREREGEGGGGRTSGLSCQGPTLIEGLLRRLRGRGRDSRAKMD